jgi:hypothetical protein
MATYGVKFGATKNAPTLTTKIMNSVRSGTLTFSDGSSMTFNNGLLTEVTSKSSEAKWSGN